MENQYSKYNAKAWINANEMTAEQRKDMFPGLTSDACANVPGGIALSGNYDQVTFDNQIASYVAENGQPCWYYPYLFQEEKMEELTGEHSGAGYGRPFEILIVLEVKDSPSWVSALGVENDETVTGWIHIRSFKEKIRPILKKQDDDRYIDYNSIYCDEPWKVLENDKTRKDVYAKKIQPKPKDCFQSLLISNDREWDAGARIWEITNVEDEIISEKFNLSQGHYVWKITAKRYRYSFEHGMSIHDNKASDNPMLGEMGEHGNHQVYENDIVKMYLGTTEIVDEDDISVTLFTEDDKEGIVTEDGIWTKVVNYEKKYSQDEVCEDAKKEVFDMDKNVKGFYEHVDSGGFF
jgi:hypothetical protein